MKLLVIYLCGLLFGTGLIVSGMINPAKVIGFLDVSGQWDPSLAFVMAGAVTVTFVGYSIVLRRGRPYFTPDFSLPTRSDIDAPLLFGPMLFGAGWGLVGLCPGPAIVAITTLPKATWVFFVSMVFGMTVVKQLSSRKYSVKYFGGTRRFRRDAK